MILKLDVDKAELQPTNRQLLDFKYTKNEFFTLIFPLLCGSSVFLTLVVIGSDRTRPQFLYFSLPLKFKNPWTFMSLFLVELLSFGIASSSLYFGIVSKLLFFQKCDQRFSEFESRLRLKFQIYQTPKTVHGH